MALKNTPPTAKTLSFYENNADSYFEQTHDVNLEHLYVPFFARLPKGARILDVGCGSGRDLRVFRERGYRPIGLEPSKKLAGIARKYSGVKVVQKFVEDLDFKDAFDAVWACASLLHIPREDLPEALVHVHECLVKEGIFFLSVQTGVGEGFSADGRYYSFYHEADIRKIVSQSGFRVESIWTTSDLLKSRTNISWINLLSRKVV